MSHGCCDSGAGYDGGEGDGSDPDPGPPGGMYVVWGMIGCILLAAVIAGGQILYEYWSFGPAAPSPTYAPTTTPTEWSDSQAWAHAQTAGQKCLWRFVSEPDDLVWKICRDWPLDSADQPFILRLDVGLSIERWARLSQAQPDGTPACVAVVRDDAGQLEPVPAEGKANGSSGGVSFRAQIGAFVPGQPTHAAHLEITCGGRPEPVLQLGGLLLPS